MKWTPDLEVLESAIFSVRKDGRIADIREAWAVWVREYDLTPLERFVRWVKRLIKGAP